MDLRAPASSPTSTAQSAAAPTPVPPPQPASRLARVASTWLAEKFADAPTSISPEEAEAAALELAADQQVGASEGLDDGAALQQPEAQEIAEDSAPTVEDVQAAVRNALYEKDRFVQTLDEGAVLRGEPLDTPPEQVLTQAVNRVAFALQAGAASGARELEQRLLSRAAKDRKPLMAVLENALEQLRAELCGLASASSEHAPSELESALASLARAAELVDAEQAQSLASLLGDAAAEYGAVFGDEALSALLRACLAERTDHVQAAGRAWAQAALGLSTAGHAAAAEQVMRALAEALRARRERFQRAMERLRRLEKRLARLLRRARGRWSQSALARAVAAFQQAFAEEYSEREGAAGELASLLPGVGELVIGSGQLSRSEGSKAACHEALRVLAEVPELLTSLEGQRRIEGWLSSQQHGINGELTALSLVTLLLAQLAEGNAQRLASIGLPRERFAGIQSPFRAELSNALVRGAAPSLLRASRQSAFEAARVAQALVTANAELLGLTADAAYALVTSLDAVAKARNPSELLLALKACRGAHPNAKPAPWLEALALSVALPLCERQARAPETQEPLAAALSSLAPTAEAVRLLTSSVRRTAIRIGELPPALAPERADVLSTPRLACALAVLGRATGQQDLRTPTAGELNCLAEALGMAIGPEVADALLEEVLGLESSAAPESKADSIELDEDLATVERIAGARTLRPPEPPAVLRAVPSAKEAAKTSGRPLLARAS